MHILFIGDIMGRPGREVVAAQLPGLREALAARFRRRQWRERRPAASASPRSVANEMFALGIDVPHHRAITGRTSRRYSPSSITTTASCARAIIPPGTPGKGAGLYETRKGERAGDNVMGRVFMDATRRSVRRADAELAACPLGEAATRRSSTCTPKPPVEKMAHRPFLRRPRQSGRRHPFAHSDRRRANFPGGTAYQTDAGACADYDFVIGMEKFEPLQRFTKKMPASRFTPATGPATLCGVFVATNAKGLRDPHRAGAGGGAAEAVYSVGLMRQRNPARNHVSRSNAKRAGACSISGAAIGGTSGVRRCAKASTIAATAHNDAKGM